MTYFARHAVVSCKRRHNDHLNSQHSRVEEEGDESGVVEGPDSRHFGGIVLTCRRIIIIIII